MRNTIWMDAFKKYLNILRKGFMHLEKINQIVQRVYHGN